MISPKNKRSLFRIIPFGLYPFILSVVYSLLEKGVLGDATSYPSTGNTYTFQIILPATLSMFAGILIGAFEVFYLNKSFRKYNFSSKIILKTVVYFILITMAILVTMMLNKSLEQDVSPFSSQVWHEIFNFLESFAFWSTLIYFILGLVLCLFYIEVSDNIGQAVLINFFTGKYHRPIEEERIFMFLDMKSSTTIAEKLGHIHYFKMLNEYYADLTAPIIDFGGEIYQYVGDEVIVSWKLKKRMINNCLNCYFSMKKALSTQAEKYQVKYGLVPTFKAGIHFGKVTTGEIGVIKKEIIFSGDVLNTTARIQGLCNSYNVDLLVSEKLIKALNSNEKFEIKELGEVELRGRNEKINLFTLKEIKEII